MILSRQAALHALDLRFYDLDVHIRADRSESLELFARMYRHFQADGARLPAQHTLEFDLLTGPGNAWGRPVLLVDGQAWPLHDDRLLAGYVYEGMLKHILARIRSHVLLHAAALAREGGGLILAGDSGCGKTTLALALAQRGFRFLSDEMAALGRANRLLHPFPRALRVRPDTLERVGLAQAAAGASQWMGKWILDVEDLQVGSLGQAVPLRQVIILQYPAAEPGSAPGSPDSELGVLFDRLDEDTLDAVRRIEGVVEVQAAELYGYPLLKLHTARPAYACSQIEALCQARRIWVLDVLAEPARRPTFDAPARLEALSPSQAALELVRRFQGGHQSALLQDEFDGRSSRLYVEIASLIGQANCYRLSVGPLDEMVERVCGLVRGVSRVA